MDYFWQFSLVIPIQNDAEHAFWKEIIETPWKSKAYKAALAIEGEEPEEDDTSLRLGIEWDGFKSAEDKEKHPERAKQIWIHDDGQSNTQFAWEIIHQFLKAHRPHDYLFVQWGVTASRPVTDGYGGGTVFISADAIIDEPTHKWQLEMNRKHKKKHPKGKRITVVE